MNCFFGSLANGGAGPTLSATETGRRAALWCWIALDIAEGEHLSESILFFRLETAFSDGFFGIVKSTEEHVPNWEVSVIVSVVPVGVMKTMGFGALDEKSEPARRAHIPVVEIFSNGDEEGVVGGGFNGTAEKGVNNSAAEDGVECDFDGVFVKTGQKFNALW